MGGAKSSETSPGTAPSGGKKSLILTKKVQIITKTTHSTSYSTSARMFSEIMSTIQTMLSMVV